MKLNSFLEDYHKFPAPGNKHIADTKLSEFTESNRVDEILKKRILDFSKNKAGLALLRSIFGNSQYLTQAILKEPCFFLDFCESGLDKNFQNILDALKQIDVSIQTKESLMRELRKLKLKCSLLIAVADISENWSLDKITTSLSEFADLAIQISLNFLLFESAKKQQLEIYNNNNPSEKSGLIILAVGKLGSKELNYSSDIDLIILYEEKNTYLKVRSSLSRFFVNIAQELSNILQTRTEDGYVFRTDLRLRPDPGSTPLAVSVESAENYYETVGQNWERAAMIKARQVAGDFEAGNKFTEFLKRYVWRKYLDFASIQDIHSIKRQIDSKIGELPEKLLGYNIKLGHGGIREIEFYIQTQQLIWGGKESSLQIPKTFDALRQLSELKKIDSKTCLEMQSAYEFYRTIEHRLQMIADSQTHSLPQDVKALEEFSVFMNFKRPEEFIEKLKQTIFLVKNHYSKLFEHSPSLASGAPGIEGSLVFTGIENDPETLKTLQRMGFSEPDRISEIIRGWHHGRRRSTRTKRVREILTEFMPLILKAFSQTINPDTAFKKFDEFLSRLPAGVQLFSLCYANPQLLNLIAEIMGGYPYIANDLSRKPSLLEYVLSSEFFEKMHNLEELNNELKNYLKESSDLEEILNLTREWSKDRQFRIGIQFIKEKINHVQVSQHLCDIADVVLTNTFYHVQNYFEKQYGKATGYEFAIIALGKLGSRELTFGSDIDLVFVYDDYSTQGDNSKISLSPSEYFTRLSRRYVSAINTMTEFGKLYEVDTRLRPSGKDGPVVSYVDSYQKYYEESAWSWEFMALTRARILLAPDKLKSKLENIIHNNLLIKRDKIQLSRDISEMRERVTKTHKSNNIFDVKYVSGGLIDIEYIIQFLKLLHGEKYPSILVSSTSLSISELKKSGLIETAEEKILTSSFTLQQNLQAVLRLMNNEKPEEDTINEGMKKILCQATSCKKFEELKKNLEKSQKNVQNLYTKYIASGN